MTVRSKLLTTLSSIAFGTTAVLAPATAADLPYAQQAGFFGLVTALSNACLVQTSPGVYEIVRTDLTIQRCCAVVREIGQENADFLRAVALGDPQDPRLRVLDDRLVAVLLSCHQDAMDRLGELAMNASSGPTPSPSSSDIYSA